MNYLVVYYVAGEVGVYDEVETYQEAQNSLLEALAEGMPLAEIVENKTAPYFAH